MTQERKTWTTLGSSGKNKVISGKSRETHWFVTTTFHNLGIGVTVARLTLDQLVMVRIHDPQFAEGPRILAVRGPYSFATTSENSPLSPFFLAISKRPLRT